MGSNQIGFFKDIIYNFFLNKKYNLTYIVETADWVIKFDGIYITKNINKLNLLKTRISRSYYGLRNQLIHFGSVNTFISKSGLRKIHSSNKIILTWFHIVPNDVRIKFINKLNKMGIFVHTASQVNKNKLVEFGLNEDRVVVIPLGIDVSIFKTTSRKKKEELRKRLKIPLDKIVIGSFQKDGIGWGKGQYPKMIKGPDIFVEVIDKLSKVYPIFILLVGPARGYVSARLAERGIHFKNIGYVRNLEKVAKYYHILDLYLITSRIEGGPKQVFEAWASGVPVVSTKVGMIPDVSKAELDIMLAQNEDIEQIVKQAQKVIDNETLKMKLIKNGLKSVENYSWEKITTRYYKEIYSKLL